MHRIIGKSRRIVAVGVAAGNPEHPLAYQIVQAVLDFARLAFIHEALGNPTGQLQPIIARLEQHRATIRAALRLIKPRHHRPVKQLAKQYTLSCDIVSHAKASFLIHLS